MSESNSSSSSQRIIVKWGKETIELLLDLRVVGVAGLKHEVCEKTGVPVARQKLMCKVPKNLWKGVLKDDIDVNAINGNEIQLLLMGSAPDQELKGPTVKTVFEEDLKGEEKALVAAEPSGLVNLGNTCYLNSVVQCLRAVPQLQSTLGSFTPNSASASSSLSPAAANNTVQQSMFTAALADTYKQLNRQTTPVSPYALVQLVKAVFPQFRQTAPNGAPMQQDAEEFYSGVLTILSEQLPRNGAAAAASSAAAATTSESSTRSNAVDSLFGMRMKETLTCDECSTATATITADGATAALASALSKGGEMNIVMDTINQAIDNLEPPVTSFDWHRKLVCNIQGGSDGSNIVVNHVNEGILLGLTGKIEKHSNVLGRNAVWTRSQRLANLPPVLVIQFGRFYWKATPDSADHTGVKCKVMKPVAFNDTLDVYDFCTPEIQAVLNKARRAAREAEERAIQLKLEGKTENDTTEVKSDVVMEEGDDDDDADLKAALAMSMQEAANEDADDDVADVAAILGPGIPTTFQGHYELFAVVTHKGRDADGGHYMAWVKSDHQRNNDSEHAAAATAAAAKGPKKIADTNMVNEDWFVFDDDEVSPCKTEDVLKLKGGGDWHMSYLNFYRIKK